MKSLTIGIVTRGRRELVQWTALETLRNAREPGTKIVVLADHDDEDMLNAVLPEGVILDIRQREDSVGAKWNRMMSIAPADVYMAMCDYRPQSTPGFDTNILDAARVFPDGIGCVTQRLANLSFPTYQCLTAKTVELMGHFYVEHFPYWFVDHWLDDLSKMTGRAIYAPGETVVGKRPGPGTQDFREPGLWAALYDALYEEREAEAEKWLAAMDEPDWRKDMLRRNWPMVHERSRMINSIVRNMEGNAPFDERYSRIRAIGAAKLTEKFHELERRAA